MKKSRQTLFFVTTFFSYFALYFHANMQITCSWYEKCKSFNEREWKKELKVGRLTSIN